MKNQILALFILCFLQSTMAQDSTIGKHHAYRIKVKVDESTTSFGFLAWLTDSTLYYSKEYRKYSPVNVFDSNLEVFRFTNIKTVDMFTASPSATVLIPASVGLLGGAIWGYSMGDDPANDWFRTTAGEKAAILGVVGFASGAVIGGIITIADHHYYSIHGKKEKFEKFVSFIRKKEDKN